MNLNKKNSCHYLARVRVICSTKSIVVSTCDVKSAYHPILLESRLYRATPTGSIPYAGAGKWTAWPSQNMNAMATMCKTSQPGLKSMNLYITASYFQRRVPMAYTSDIPARCTHHQPILG